MDERPDSAWAALTTLSLDEMGQNRTRARYALLYTQAQDKNYIDETNDSLISVAVDYYRHTDDVRRKFLSFYYRGRVYTNAKDYLNATSCYMEAEQLVDEVGDDYLSGLLYADWDLIHTITADNGKEFAKHQEIYFYFCKPFHSWERGANENTNGLIRQYIPKGADFSGITDEFVAWVENKLNNRPRKRLGYLTPNEKFNLIRLCDWTMFTAYNVLPPQCF